MRILWLCVILCPLFSFGQYRFSGQLPHDHVGETVYLSIVDNYRKSSRIYLDQLIGETVTDSLGQFVFAGDQLSNKNHLYRIHTDNCNTTGEKPSHFLKKCIHTQSVLFLAKNSDTIALPLLENDQPLCEINSTNKASNLILEIDALREEMIIDFMEYPSKANENLNFKKWFSRLQEFAVQTGEPLAELYVYDFLSDRASETHTYYLNDLQSSTYYNELLTRLESNYPGASFTEQYQRESTADKIVQDASVQPNTFPLKYLGYLAIALLPLVLLYFNYRKKGNKKKKAYLDVLTGQEKNIMSKIAEGKSNKEIAAELFISLSTVKTHINNLYKKLNVSSREDLKSLF